MSAAWLTDIGVLQELRLTRGLWLREALVILFASITHESSGVVDVECWRNGDKYGLIGVENDRLMCLDTRWRKGNRLLAVSLASRVDSLGLFENENGFLRVSSRLAHAVNRFEFVQRPKPTNSNRFATIPSRVYYRGLFEKTESIRRKLESILLFESGFGNDLRVDSGDPGIDSLESRF
ncbi:hypothetical protein PIB30_061100 [Stylosanthes scabra]|uniref:Uncharacterized protein n=1 Tax=Stylosanthes scabra TaxID=79078 RepID=A0ABU6VNT7_9FABA|nr:hypothetical protein [Stylosanthes scabra]